MGIVIQQSVKNTLSTYIGFAIGALNTLVFYTHFLSASDYGIVALLLSIATVGAPFILFGSHQMLIRFYPKYSGIEQAKLMTLSLLIPLVLSFVFGLVLFFFQDSLLRFIQSDSTLTPYFLWDVYFIAVFMAFFEYFYALSRSQLKSVMGNFAKEVLHRLLIALGLIALSFDWLDFNSFLVLLIVIYGLRMLLMAVYSLRVTSIHWSVKLSNFKRAHLVYALVMLMGSAAALVILEVDKIMINMYLDLDQVAYYTVAVFIATLVAVPFRAMHQITLPITAQLIAAKDFKGLSVLYKKSSLNLSIVTALVLILLLVNIDNLYQLIPEAYSQAIFVVYLLGIAKFIDASLGINNAIINNSPFYAYVLGFGVVLAVLTILFNMWLLPVYGILGAAYASLAALLIYNLLKLVLVVVNYKIQPYSSKTIVVLVLSIGIYFAVTNMSSVENLYLDIIIKSFVSLFVYLGICYKINLSTSINQLIDKLLRRA
jgi:O-antigen/teichoic acid export membrane protein